jgi:hypothetical protein
MDGFSTGLFPEVRKIPTRAVKKNRTKIHMPAMASLFSRKRSQNS